MLHGCCVRGSLLINACCMCVAYMLRLRLHVPVAHVVGRCWDWDRAHADEVLRGGIAELGLLLEPTDHRLLHYGNRITAMGLYAQRQSSSVSSMQSELHYERRPVWPPPCRTASGLAGACVAALSAHRSRDRRRRERQAAQPPPTCTRRPPQAPAPRRLMAARGQLVSVT